MGIYIPDMEMPKSCSRCVFECGGYAGACKLLREGFFWDKEDLSDCRTWTRKEFDFEEDRLPNCPLREIPHVCDADFDDPNMDIMRIVKAISEASGISLKNEDGTYKSPLDFTKEASEWMKQLNKEESKTLQLYEYSDGIYIPETYSSVVFKVKGDDKEYTGYLDSSSEFVDRNRNTPYMPHQIEAWHYEEYLTMGWSSEHEEEQE